MLKIALPNKGALSDDTVTLVREAGYKVRRDSKDLIARDPHHEVEFFFLRPRDIAIYVGAGVLDLGVTGRDLARESGAPVEEVMQLGFGRAAFHYAVPRDSGLTPDRLGGLRIATSYPELVRHDLDTRGIEATVVPLDGAVEIATALGVADAVADVVQTGRTLEQAGLVTTGEPILESEALLVSREGGMPDDPRARTFVERVRGIIVARAYVMIEYDIETDRLDAACAITPGIESPTVAPLSKAGWMAVKAMARRREVNDLMDRLAELGARGILVHDIRTCRI